MGSANTKFIRKRTRVAAAIQGGTQPALRRAEAGDLQVCVYASSTGVKRLHQEEQIRSRLRELTAETRRVREELRQMIRRDQTRTDAPSYEQIQKIKRGGRNS